MFHVFLIPKLKYHTPRAFDPRCVAVSGVVQPPPLL